MRCMLQRFTTDALHTTPIPSKNYFHSLLFTTRQSNLYFSDTRGKAAHKTHTTGITNYFLMARPTRKCVLVFYFHIFQFILHLNIYIKHQKIWHAPGAIFTSQLILKIIAKHWKCIKYPMAAWAQENLTRSTANYVKIKPNTKIY